MARTVVWKSRKALACSVKRPISLDIGAQLTRTSGKLFLPSEWLSSYDRTTYRGEFSGSSAFAYVPHYGRRREGDRRSSTMAKEGGEVCAHTFREVLDADVVKLLDLLHHQLLLVDLDHDGGMSSIAPREPELAEGGLELLRDVNGAGLHHASAGDADGDIEKDPSSESLMIRDGAGTQTMTMARIAVM